MSPWFVAAGQNKFLLEIRNQLPQLVVALAFVAAPDRALQHEDRLTTSASCSRGDPASPQIPSGRSWSG
jgi:hypothetical protein